MTVYKWDGILEIFMKYPGKFFPVKKLCELTGLSRGYVSKYLCKWAKAGIAVHKGETYGLGDESKAVRLISRAVDATAGGDTSRPPPSIHTAPHHFLIDKTIYFGHPDAKEAVEIYTVTAMQNPGRKDLPHLTGPGDRAKRIVIPGRSFTATVSRQGYNGTIAITRPYEDWRAELKQTFGDTVYDQIRSEEAVAHVEVRASDIRREVLEKYGIEVFFEVEGSQLGAEALEIHGQTEPKARMALDLATRRHVENSLIIVNMAKDLTALRQMTDELKAAVSIQTQTSGQVVHAVMQVSANVESQGKATAAAIQALADRMGQFLGQGAGPAVAAPSGPAGPYKGMDPGVG